MEISSKDKMSISHFFKNPKLESLFIQLYNYELTYTPDLIYDDQKTVIGFKKEGERCKLYVAKMTGKIFFAKAKNGKNIPFDSDHYEKIKNDLDLERQPVVESIETKQVEDKEDIVSQNSVVETKDDNIELDEAEQILCKYYGKNAKFRDGQHEAILATQKNRRTLVVQRTGWGKSLVYFISTKIFRNHGSGATFVVSPLISLMDNQIEAAKKFDLNCDVLNSKTRDNREEIINNIISDKLDIVFITPETLFSIDIQEHLKDIRIGLLVIDECHCISDWGHDFRLEYGNLNRIIKVLPRNIPILATTATANNRVVEDLKSQMGNDVYISRGPLTRESLCIQVVKAPNVAYRYAWIKKNINKLPGTGIIYCLTRRDCYFLSKFLVLNGISAMPYYSSKDEERQDEALRRFSKNQIKVIVATVKLGMGYDKGDVGFVIHFQQPSNIVSYYQQIGRAGRNLDKAYAILMTGAEDDRIINNFIETAFPTSYECEKVINIIKSHNGISNQFIKSKLNINNKRIDKTLDFLVNENAIYKDEWKYFVSINKFKYNEEHYNEIKNIRRKEKQQMLDLVNTKECYSKYIANCLDDYSATECHKCANCLGHDLIGEEVTSQDEQNALDFILNQYLIIKPILKWTYTLETNNMPIEFVNNEGVCLSKYGDIGYGHFVKEDKYGLGQFRTLLVEKSAKVLQRYIKKNGITHITFVPSLRNDKVKNFTSRLADKTGLTFVDALEKEEAPQQKTMENSAHQCYNAYKSFKAKDVSIPYNFLLVDDMVDSRWTLTVCGYRLMEKGALSVTPFALADSSERED